MHVIKKSKDGIKLTILISKINCDYARVVWYVAHNIMTKAFEKEEKRFGLDWIGLDTWNWCVWSSVQ